MTSAATTTTSNTGQDADSNDSRTPAGRDSGNAAESGAESSARRSNDEQIEQMLQRMRNLGRGAAMSDIMFGLGQNGGRRQQQADDDRNEYAGLYS